MEGPESLSRLIVDDPPVAKSVLGKLGLIFEETDVAVVRLPHTPGQLGRAATCLGENQINIDYSYLGLEPGSTSALLVFGVDSLTKAAAALDQLATKADHRSFAHQLRHHLPAASIRAVFEYIQALPRSQGHPPVNHRNRQARVCKRRPNMRSHIIRAFERVPVMPSTFWDQPLKVIA